MKCNCECFDIRHPAFDNPLLAPRQGAARPKPPCRTSAVGCRLSNVGCRMSNVGCRMSAAGCRLPNVGCRMSAAETFNPYRLRNASALRNIRHSAKTAARILVARRCKQARIHWRIHNTAYVCAIIARLRSVAWNCSYFQRIKIAPTRQILPIAPNANGGNVV